MASRNGDDEARRKKRVAMAMGKIHALIEMGAGADAIIQTALAVLMYRHDLKVVEFDIDEFFDATVGSVGLATEIDPESERLRVTRMTDAPGGTKVPS